MTTYEKAKIAITHMIRNSLIGEETSAYSEDRFVVIKFYDTSNKYYGNYYLLQPTERSMTFGEITNAISELIEDAKNASH